MKIQKIAFLLILLIGISKQLLAQKDSIKPSMGIPIIEPIVKEYQLTPPKELSNELKTYLNSKLSSYSIYNFDYTDLNNYLINNKQAMRINLKNNSITNQIILQRQDVRNSNYTETETNLQNQNIINYLRTDSTDTNFVVRTLKGFANSDKAKICRFIIEQNNFNGYILNSNTNKLIYYTSLQDFIKSNGNDFETSENYLLEFDLTNLLTNSNSFCGNIGDALNKEDEEFNNPNAKGYFDKCTPRFLEIAAEGDKQWCDLWGINASAKIIHNIFLVEGIYTSNFNLSFVVNNVNLVPNNSNLYTTNVAVDLLDQFRVNWSTNHSLIDRDVALLYTGRKLNAGVLGIAYVSTICSNYGYLVVSNNPHIILTNTHELGHSFSSQHDNGPGGYNTSACSGIDVPIMCASVPATAVQGNNFFFTQFTRDLILNDINSHASCLNDNNNGNPSALILKSWSNFRNPRHVSTWFLNIFDQKVVGNFDGDNEDEEILFVNTDGNGWSTMVDFSCDQGTDWYHLWSNFSSNSIGSWILNSGDKFFTGDFNGDGKDELLTVSQNAKWVGIHEYLPNNWNWINIFNNGGTSNVSGWNFNTNDFYITGDFDGDNTDELLCINGNGWAQMLKFIWSGSYYSASTIWSNNGNGWIGGVQIGNTNRILSGKFTNSIKDELFTISGTWVSTQKFDGTNWQWLWSQYGANNFANMYILPLSNTSPLFSSPNNYIHTFSGNFDADTKDEFVVVGSQWVASADYNGTTYNQNWNNTGNNLLNDWDLNNISNYIFVKASPTESKQILGTNFLKKKSGWWFFSEEWIEPHQCGMYRGNDVFQNFRTFPPKSDINKNEIKIYPNPSSDIINVEFDMSIEFANISIVNETGKIVSTIKTANNKNSISIKNLSTGIYFINIIYSNNTKFTYKFIKNEN